MNVNGGGIRMGIQQTSLEAYVSIVFDLSNKQQRVYQLIKRLQPCSNKQISEYSRLAINSITPRVLELRKKGIVSNQGTRICPVTGKREMLWTAS